MSISELSKRTVLLSICGLLLFLLLFSCSGDRQGEMEIDFSIDQLSESTISDALSEYSVIKLQTTPESRLHNIKKVIIRDDKIYVLNYMVNRQEIMIFLADGSFVRKIPAEHEQEIILSIADFDLHPVQGFIVVLDKKGKSIIEFTEKGEVRQQIAFDYNADEIAFGNTQGNVFAVVGLDKSAQNKKSKCEIIVLNEKYKAVKSFFPVDDDIFYVKSSMKSLYKQDGKVNFLKNGSNQLYQLGPDDYKKYRTLNFSRSVLPENKMYEAFFTGEVNPGDYVFNIGFYESDETFYTEFSSMEGNFIGLYNKVNKRSQLFNMLLDPKCKCDVKINVTGSFGDYFIVQVPRAKIRDMIDLLDYERVKCTNPEIFPRIDAMQPGENPVLLFMSFRQI